MKFQSLTMNLEKMMRQGEEDYGGHAERLMVTCSPRMAGLVSVLCKLIHMGSISNKIQMKKSKL